ncbi:hypothetical protein K7X08_006274 [Anisodus acutangulus]|uniref:PB1 domain-containing protein n=1 Tax=Anisodus acutangulus TaxID=402998 RepID=A0A9Q1RNQ9_9SOLA|nr:hypothetical protein K7X08_006274 [Anisodus acutangulus]
MSRANVRIPGAEVTNAILPGKAQTTLSKRVLLLETNIAQGLQEEPHLLERSASKGKGTVVNSDRQFHDDTQNHNGANKDIAKSSSVRKESTIGLAPIVSARLKYPRITSIFRFKSAFTIEGLRRSVANKFDWDDNVGTQFDLHYVNEQNERAFLIDSDEHVMKLFDTSKPRDFVVFVMDVQLHEVTEGDLSAKGNKRCRDPKTGRGVELYINRDGFKMAYEAVDSIFTLTNRNERMAIIIGAARNKKLRIGEYSSTVQVSGNSNVNKHYALYGDQQGMQHSASETPSNMEVSTVETTHNTASAETTNGTEKELHQPLESDHSALSIEENPSNVEANMKITSEQEVAQELDCMQFPELKCKCLTLKLHITKYNLYGVASFLQASPHVETFNIEMKERHDKIFELSQFMLKNAIVLERFVIIANRSKCWKCSENFLCGPLNSSKLAAKLSGCARPSAYFEIIFRESGFSD